MGQGKTWSWVQIDQLTYFFVEDKWALLEHPCYYCNELMVDNPDLLKSANACVSTLK